MKSAERNILDFHLKKKIKSKTFKYDNFIRTYIFLLKIFNTSACINAYPNFSTILKINLLIQGKTTASKVAGLSPFH